MMRRWPALVCVLMVIAGMVYVSSAYAQAAKGGCPDPTVSLIQAEAECEWEYVEYQALIANSPTHIWTTTRVCEVGSAALCDVFLSCTRDGVTAWMNQILMDGIPVGQVCIPEKDEEVDVGAMAIREFKRIRWPKSHLVVQPPNGKTLVNFETNFFTLDKRSIDQTVTLVERQVEIRATPTSYTFDFGDGTSTTTASPGRPHPDLDITHVYEDLGTVEVRLDTTYTGEYRIGDGDWVAIPDTVTVAGATQDLEILEAVPQLVLR